MESKTRKGTGRRPAATLFDNVTTVDEAEFRERVKTFAEEVAQRHRGGRGDLNAMLRALHGWHRTWAICAPHRVPQQLDDAAVRVAVAAYERGTGARGRHAAA